MIEAAFIGALLGGAMGLLIGLLIAATTNEGIWPHVWAGLILTVAAFGAVVGAIDYSAGGF